MMEEEIGVQGMRGWSATAVMLYHITLFLPAFTLGALIPVVSSGYSGVELFFMISGYILMRKFQEGDYNKKNRFDAKKYYIRRFFRIWPLYALAIFIFALPLTGLAVLPQSFLFLQDYASATFQAGPLWTICVEALFYLILPVWVVVFDRSWRSALLAALCVSVGYAAFFSYIVHVPSDLLPYVYSQFPTYALCYAFGTIIAKGKSIKIWWPLILAVWLFVSLALPTTSNSYAEYWWFTPVAFSLVYFLVLGNLRESKIFTNQVSRTLGSITYPLYLFSVPIIAETRYVLGISNVYLWVPLSIIFTVYLSLSLHFFVEKPFIGVGEKVLAQLSGSRVAKRPASSKADSEQNLRFSATYFTIGLVTQAFFLAFMVSLAETAARAVLRVQQVAANFPWLWLSCVLLPLLLFLCYSRVSGKGIRTTAVLMFVLGAFLSLIFFYELQ